MKLIDLIRNIGEWSQQIISKSHHGFWATHLRTSRLTLIVLTGTVAVIQLSGLPSKLSSTTLESAIQLQTKEAAPNVFIVEIDDDDYAKLFHNTSPLEPQVIGQMIEAIIRGGAKVIVVDIETSDAPFQALQLPTDGPPIIWSASVRQDNNKLRKPLGGMDLPVGSQVGLAEVPLDSKSVVRSYARFVAVGSNSYFPALSFAAREAFRGQAVKQMAAVPRDNELFFDYRYRFKYLTAQNLIAIAKPERLSAWINDGLFKDKVVVIGGTYWAGKDLLATPIGLSPGVEIIAQSIQTEISGTGISPIRKWVLGALQVMGGLTIVGLYRRFRLRSAMLGTLLLIPVLAFVCRYLLFSRLAFWFWVAPVVLVVLVTQLYEQASAYSKLYERVAALRRAS